MADLDDAKAPDGGALGSLGDERVPRGFVDHLDAKLLRFLELRARARTGDDEVRLRRNRARRLGAQLLGLGLGLVARQGFQRAGEDDRLASDRRLPDLPD